MRDLASVVTIESTQKMFQKDKIQCVTMKENGYEAITSVDLNPGDLAIFIQEGSILPVKEQWEFLRKRCFNESWNGFIIKPMTMGKKAIFVDSGEIEGDRVKSWGLIVKLNEAGLDESIIKKLKAGDDVTDLLEIRKYETEEDASPTTKSKKAYPKWVKFCLSHKLTKWIGVIWQRNHQNSAGGFPVGEVHKSDETTIQNMKHATTTFAEDKVYVSAKMEGQSSTTAFDVLRLNGRLKKVKKFYVCSRNNAYKLKCNNDFWNFCVKHDLEKKLLKFYKETGKLLIIQAEQCGPGIQNNIYNLKDIDWYVYLIEDMVTKTQLNLEDMIAACNELGLKTVPILEKDVRLGDIMPDIDAAVKYAENASWKIKDGELILNYKPAENEVLWKDYMQHEGVVVRSMNCDKMKNIGVSFKVKNLAYNEKGLPAIAAAAKN